MKDLSDTLKFMGSANRTKRITKLGRGGPESILQHLSHKKRRNREDAVIALSVRTLLNERDFLNGRNDLIDSMLEFATDASNEARSSAIENLAAIGTDSALAVVAANISELEEMARRRIATRLLQHQDPKSIEILSRLAIDQDAMTRERARESLKKLGEPGRAALDILPEEGGAQEARTAPALPKPTEFEGPLGEEIRAEFKTLEDAYLAVHDEQLEGKVMSALDTIASKGVPGVRFLFSQLFKDLSLVGDSLVHPPWGDYTWNEWLKRREIVRAIARSKTTRLEVLGGLQLLTEVTGDAQFHEILVPAVRQALTELDVPDLKADEERTVAAVGGPRCAVCGRDLSAMPAVRDNVTGAMYCYDHREQADR